MLKRQTKSQKITRALNYRLGGFTLLEMLIVTPIRKRLRLFLRGRSASAFNLRQTRGFTLLELLIVIGIIAILTAVIVMVINPAELLRQTRDSKRISDLDSLNHALTLAMGIKPGIELGATSTIYVSLPDATSSTCANLGLPDLPSGWHYHCSNSADLQKVDGSGWIPVDFASLATGSPLSNLPVDPLNVYTDNGSGDDDFYYVYAAGSFELAAKTESGRYADNPNIDADTGLYRVGSKRHLFPGLAGLCPLGNTWKHHPARKCVPGEAFGYLSQSASADFVLFADKEIELAGKAQISSGRIGANQKIKIAADNIVSGDLLSDEIEIAQNSQINANVSYNKLITGAGVQILGQKISPLSLPVNQLPETVEMPVGKENIVISQSGQTLKPGSYDKIEIEANASLILDSGVYNLGKLFLEENAKLYTKPDTVIGIRDEFETAERSAIAPENLTDENPRINYSGKKTVSLGDSSFLAFQLLAPRAEVQIGDNVTFRGNVWGKEIKVGGDTIFSAAKEFEKESDLSKMAEFSGVKYIRNEIVILFKDGVAIDDLLTVANLVNGQVTGFLPDLAMGKIEVAAQSIDELNGLINLIKNSNNPLIDDVLPNALIL